MAFWALNQIDRSNDKYATKNYRAKYYGTDNFRERLFLVHLFFSRIKYWVITTIRLSGCQFQHISMLIRFGQDAIPNTDIAMDNTSRGEPFGSLARSRRYAKKTNTLKTNIARVNHYVALASRSRSNKAWLPKAVYIIKRGSMNSVIAQLTSRTIRNQKAPRIIFWFECSNSKLGKIHRRVRSSGMVSHTSTKNVMQKDVHSAIPATN